MISYKDQTDQTDQSALSSHKGIVRVFDLLRFQRANEAFSCAFEFEVEVG